MNGRCTIPHLLTVIALLTCVSVLSAQTERVIELKSAKQLIGRTVDNEIVRELIGDVHFVQTTEEGGPVKVWCDRALQYLEQNRMELIGSVRVVRDSVTIFAPSGMYDGNLRRMEARNGVKLVRGRTVLTSRIGDYLADAKRAHFRTNVVLVDSASRITCNDLTYFETQGRSVAVGKVHVFESSNSTDVYGDSLVHIDSTGYSFISGNPRLVRVDTSGGGTLDTMVVASRFMHSYRDTAQRFVAQENVRMVRSDMASRCGRATFEVDKDRIRLETHPIVWSGDNQITGDSMTVRMNDRRLRSLFVKGKAMAVSRADSIRLQRFHQLTGRQMTLYFGQNKLERVVVERNATSLYYLYDDGTPNGLNRSSGDRIAIDFTAGTAEQIRIAGGVLGQYVPERLVAGHEADQNLDGFRWFEQRPQRKGLTIVD
jgi:lipopolysaccharide export system protein LptA